MLHFTEFIKNFAMSIMSNTYIAQLEEQIFNT